MLRAKKFAVWPSRLCEIYTEYFSDSTRLEKMISQSAIGASLKELKKDQFLEQMEQEQQFLIGQDLKSQRDFLQRQLAKVKSDQNKVMASRNQAYLKVQNMNTKLINECNSMRSEKQKLKEYLGVQKKAYREVKRELAAHLGINFNDIKDEEVFPNIIENDDQQDEVEQDDHDDPNLLAEQNNYLKQRIQQLDAALAQQQEGILNLIEEVDNKPNTAASSNQTPQVTTKLPIVKNESQEQLIQPPTSAGALYPSTAGGIMSKSYSSNFPSAIAQVQQNAFTRRNQMISQAGKPKIDLPFVAYQTRNDMQKNQRAIMAQTVGGQLKPLSITEKKKNERHLMQDLLEQIKQINDNEDSTISQADKLKERVQMFLSSERKDTVAPLNLKEPILQKTTSQSTVFANRKQISQQSRNQPSPLASKASSTSTGFMQTTFNSNMMGTAMDFNRKNNTLSSQSNNHPTSK